MEAAASPVRSLAGRPTVVLVLATSLLASTAAMQAVPGVLGPFIEPSLHISQAQLGLLGAALTGGMALGLLPGGLLTDRFGERKVLSLGVGAAGAVMFGASFAGDVTVLGAMFLATSVGAAFAATGGAMTVTKWFAPNRRGTALGVRQTGVPLGGLMASLLLPAIALAADWRIAARCAAIAAVIIAALFWALYRDASGQRADDPAATARKVYRNRRFLAATGCAVTLQTAQACTLTYLPVDVHQTLGVSAAQAALFLGLAQVGAVAGRIAWGAVADWIGRRRALSLVSGVAAVCCVSMSLVDSRANVVVVAALCTVLGLAAMSWNAVYISLVAAMAPQRSIGSSLGLGLSAVLCGFLAAPVFGRIADGAHSFRPAWLGLAVVVSLGVGLSLLARTPAPGTPVRPAMPQVAR